MPRPEYSQSDYGHALKRAYAARDRMNALVESQVLHTISILLHDGDDQSADELAAHFLDAAPPHRKTARAQALLRLAGDHNV